MKLGAGKKTGARRSAIARLATIHPFNPRPLPVGLEPLVDLALDLRWTWSHAADRLSQSNDEHLWKLTRNPWLILQTVSQDRFEAIADDSWPQGEVPVGHVTNGVHAPSWDSVMADGLWTECCGKGVRAALPS